MQWFAHEARFGVPPKNPSQDPEDELPATITRPTLFQKKDKVGQFYEALNLFLHSLPFEYFVLPPSNGALLDDLNHWNFTPNAETTTVPHRENILLRLPYPSAVPIEAIEIAVPVELPQCNGILFPDVHNKGHRYSFTEDNVKRQIQKSMACKINMIVSATSFLCVLSTSQTRADSAWRKGGTALGPLVQEIESSFALCLYHTGDQAFETFDFRSAGMTSGYVEVRSSEESKHLLRDRWRLIEQLMPSDDDEDDAGSVEQQSNQEKEDEKKNESNGNKNGDKIRSEEWGFSSSTWNNVESGERFSLKRNSNEAVLYFKKDVQPGIILGPPIGGMSTFIDWII